MAATAIVTVKRFAAAKQRLAAALSGAERAAIAEAMLADTLDALGASERFTRTLVVTGEPLAAPLAAAAGAELVADPDDRSHPAAALRGIDAAERGGAEIAALLPADCPLLDAAELDAALDRLPAESVAIIPDRHGSGTNGLILRPPGAIEPAFGPGSRARHEALAEAAGVSARIEPIASMALDLDTDDDLAALAELLADRPERAPATAAALRSAVPAPRESGPSR